VEQTKELSEKLESDRQKSRKICADIEILQQNDLFLDDNQIELLDEKISSFRYYDFFFFVTF
jgi:hypothetical protein